MRTVIRTALQIYFIWLACAHRRTTLALCAKLQYLSWPSGGYREHLWRSQYDKGQGRTTHRSPVSTVERLAVTKYCVSYRLGSRTVSKLIPEVWEAYIYSVFLRLSCESIHFTYILFLQCSVFLSFSKHFMNYGVTKIRYSVSSVTTFWLNVTIILKLTSSSV